MRKTYLGKFSKDSNVNLSYFVRSYTPVVGKGFLQSSQNVVTKLLHFDGLQTFLVLSGQLGIWGEILDIKQDAWQGIRQTRKSTRNC